jgi:hypothetical protein
MSNKNNTAQGGCFCHAVRFEFDLPIKGIINCHCNMCRLLTGAAFTTWVSVPKSQFRYLQGESHLACYTVSEYSGKKFCPTCGTAVSYTDNRYQDIIGIPAGVVQDQLEQVPSAHYFVSDKASWIQLCDRLPQFGGDSGFKPVST